GRRERRRPVEKSLGVAARERREAEWDGVSGLVCVFIYGISDLLQDCCDNVFAQPVNPLSVTPYGGSSCLSMVHRGRRRREIMPRLKHTHTHTHTHPHTATH